jgi:hypothetical protein
VYNTQKMMIDTLKSQLLKPGDIDSNFIKQAKDSIEVNSQSPAGSELILGMPESLARILIPVVVSIALFFLGHFILWLKTKFEKRNEVETYKKLIIKWIELIKPAGVTQLASCNDFIDRLSKSDSMTPIRFSANKLFTEKVDTIPLERLINVFTENTNGDAEKNAKMTFNLVSQFNFLKHAEKHIENVFEGYTEAFDELAKEWNSKFTEFDDVLSTQSKELDNSRSHEHYQYHLECFKIVNEWYKNSPQDQSLKHHEEQLIDPLIDFTGNELKKKKNDYAFSLSKVMRDLKLILIQWKAAKETNCSLFQHIIENMNTSYIKLDEASSYFKNDTKSVGLFRLK